MRILSAEVEHCSIMHTHLHILDPDPKHSDWSKFRSCPIKLSLSISRTRPAFAVLRTNKCFQEKMSECGLVDYAISAMLS